MCWPYFGEGEEAANNAVCVCFVQFFFFFLSYKTGIVACLHLIVSLEVRAGFAALYICKLCHCGSDRESVTERRTHNCMHFRAQRGLALFLFLLYSYFKGVLFNCTTLLEPSHHVSQVLKRKKNGTHSLFLQSDCFQDTVKRKKNCDEAFAAYKTCLLCTFCKL